MADQILVLDKGQIIDRGTHDDLLRTSGLYGQIYQQQLRPQEVQAFFGARECDEPEETRVVQASDIVGQVSAS
jgi:hypothetical protein